MGPIGLLAIIAAKTAGAAQIIAVDVSEERLQKAKEVGATTIINAATENPVEKILALNGGVEVAYECAGAEVTVGNAVSSIRTSFAYRHIFPEVIGLIAAGRIDVKQVVTAKIELDNIVEDGFKKLLTDKSQAKILVRLSGDN